MYHLNRKVRSGVKKGKRKRKRENVCIYVDQPIVHHPPFLNVKWSQTVWSQLIKDLKGPKDLEDLEDPKCKKRRKKK